MAKILDLRKSVYELVKEFPEVADIMAELGFGEIRKEAMLNSVGKLMTIPKGAKFKKVDLSTIVNRFEMAGFTVVGLQDKKANDEKEPPDNTASGKQQRLDLLKSYLMRLNDGEPLETVRAEFVKNFSAVDASEIMEAEQELLRGGVPLEQIQQLCDVHSALFHGSTHGEKENHYEEFRDTLEVAKEQEPSAPAMTNVNTDKSETLIAVKGHPLQTFTRENEALKLLIEKAQMQLERGENCLDTLKQIRDIAIHYAKKGDLLYPMLKVRYDIIGPSQVMWSLDDEIRAELSALVKAVNYDGAWMERVRGVLQRANEMIYKEANILFPVCAANFTEEEWKQIYRDSKDYAECLGVKAETWNDAELSDAPSMSVDNGKVVLPTGEFSIDQLRALLNTLPLEISFVDADNINRYFNEGPKVFKRPMSALGREVFTCHPPKIEPMVRKIIDDFRNNRRDQVPVWMTKNGHPVLVNYMAVRDKSGKYLGAMEVVQDMEFAKNHLAH